MFHHPENFWSDAQKFLICHNTFMHYKINLHKIGVINDCPPYEFVLVEGKPGTGKYFVTKTLRNTNRLLTQRNSSYMTSDPTGCAATLIGGSTHCRCFPIPTSQHFQITQKISKPQISTRWEQWGFLCAMLFKGSWINIAWHEVLIGSGSNTKMNHWEYQKMYWRRNTTLFWLMK